MIAGPFSGPCDFVEIGFLSEMEGLSGKENARRGLAGIGLSHLF
jgi:hypothetical protein